MKRTTKLTGEGDAGKIEITIKTKLEGLEKDRISQTHNTLVEAVHKAMSDNGCFAHMIEVK